MDPLVVATFAVVVLLEIAIPLLLGWWIVRRFGVSWKVFGYGALFFVVVQVFHTPLVLVTQGPLYLFLQDLLQTETLALAGLALYLGLMAGLFEEVGRWLVFRYFFPRRSIPLRREQGLMFGAGWGGIESIFVALLVLSAMVSYIVLTSGNMVFLPDDPVVTQQAGALLALTPLDILPGLLERIMTITLHIAWSLLVLASVVYARPLLLALAVLWHTVVDFVAVYLGSTVGILVTEASLFVFFVIGLIYILWEWRRLGRSGA
ncbi:YhfC family intramembrane metalloprotease [Methanoculleus sp. FWC-SCC1]|uniref:YhfC family intramembrane metalloprotease n=1 Tax=Methanoculleus frigidifontis TaxID=2584085 RepID=A0ABT8ME10_9EURY|nr:YhfC family glutamic-type intramembrane protease [Methanoculleus sp. FWC-SCC1]MDN7026144.1 YhfC family intramembrane metalloprotease [Methanoculleus sp. FWC-SCC1]